MPDGSVVFAKHAARDRAAPAGLKSLFAMSEKVKFNDWLGDSSDEEESILLREDKVGI
jgi:hypothetical protein